ncbi:MULTISPECIES: hypothetical protein [Streptomyces]|jgi:hypothetical protein|uniref:hypothetical protein n=1 Tax=Streptomyces TaxID=1883 RepID=UPI000D528543|nr:MULTISPECIES: hypothetical protein [Streptomyces]AWE54207.1 hypothetical protein DC008_34065 [Streptomyces nigra]MCF2536258.1 hypothetical protein [Streptomyces sp. FB2]
MGTDIHGYIEVRNSCVDSSEPDDDEPLLRWHQAMLLDHIFKGRDYDAFGSLFGVRGGCSEPLAAQRGFPRDASRAATRAFEWEQENAHSASWINWAELAGQVWDSAEPRVPDEDWGDVWSVMAVLAKRHRAENVRLVVWFDN